MRQRRRLQIPDAQQLRRLRHHLDHRVWREMPTTLAESDRHHVSNSRYIEVGKGKHSGKFRWKSIGWGAVVTDALDEKREIRELEIDLTRVLLATVRGGYDISNIAGETIAFPNDDAIVHAKLSVEPLYRLEISPTPILPQLEWSPSLEMITVIKLVLQKLQQTIGET